MQEVVLTGIAIKLFMGAVGVFGMLVGLRLFDKWAGIDFRHGFDKIEECPKALALYFGLRMVALALVTAGALL